MAHVADPRADVARLALARVVADLELDLEAGSRVPRAQLLELLDAGLAIGPEQAVEAQDERTSPRTKFAQRGEVA